MNNTTTTNGVSIMLGFGDDRSELRKALDHLMWRIQTLGTAADKYQKAGDPGYRATYNKMKRLMTLHSEMLNGNAHPDTAYVNDL